MYVIFVPIFFYGPLALYSVGFLAKSVTTSSPSITFLVEAKFSVIIHGRGYAREFIIWHNKIHRLYNFLRIIKISHIGLVHVVDLMISLVRHIQATIISISFILKIIQNYLSMIMHIIVDLINKIIRLKLINIKIIKRFKTQSMDPKSRSWERYTTYPRVPPGYDNRSGDTVPASAPR